MSVFVLRPIQGSPASHPLTAGTDSSRSSNPCVVKVQGENGWIRFDTTSSSQQPRIQGSFNCLSYFYLFYPRFSIKSDCETSDAKLTQNLEQRLPLPDNYVSHTLNCFILLFGLFHVLFISHVVRL